MYTKESFLKIEDLDRALNLIGITDCDLRGFNTLNIEEKLPCGEVVFFEYVTRHDFESSVYFGDMWALGYEDEEISDNYKLLKWVLRGVSVVSVDYGKAVSLGYGDDKERIAYLSRPTKYEHIEEHFDRLLVA